jgi:hypothetical protein
LAGKRELNKGEWEERLLRSAVANPEAVDFPGVAQVALLRRTLRQHRPETVALVTSLPPSELDASAWLAANRAAWGIENGMHQRLDQSHREDQCRVRTPQSLRVLGMIRRFSVSIFMHWRSRQRKPQHKTMTDFFAAMDAEHHRYALCALRSQHPTFQTPS